MEMSKYNGRYFFFIKAPGLSGIESIMTDLEGRLLPLSPLGDYHTSVRSLSGQLKRHPPYTTVDTTKNDCAH